MAGVVSRHCELRWCEGWPVFAADWEGGIGERDLVLGDGLLAAERCPDYRVLVGFCITIGKFL